MTDFIKSILEATNEAESPKEYFYWASLAAISAVVRNNVYLSKGGLYDLKPNIYVLLIGPSGVRKGLPVSLAKKLVNEVNNTRVISGVSSIEKIIEELARAESKPDGGMIVDGTCLLVNDEFSTALLSNDMAQTYLTSLHDTIYHEDWTYQTKGGGKLTIKNPYVTILGATNIVHLNDFLLAKSVTGGFIARTFLVKADRPGKINPLVDDQEPLPIKFLAGELKELSKVKGKFCWSPGGKSLFVEWYNQIKDKLLENNYDDPTGSMNRIHDQGLKVAMLLSISKGHNLIIQVDDMEDAIRSCTEFQSTISQITAGSGSSELSLKINYFISDLIKNGPRESEGWIPHKDMMRRHYGDFEADDVPKLAETLLQAGIIEVAHNPLRYRLSVKGKQEFGGLIK
jgi:hypothetical protein